jgi:anti-sigma regulatory factor (Ser/Thr protein kinase)
MGSAPTEVVAAANDALVASIDDERFVTMVFAAARLAERGADIDIVVAGHPVPIVVRAGGAVEPLEPVGLLLGVVPAARFTVQELHLDPGDALFLYTDGVPEGRSAEPRADGKFALFGESGLVRLLTRLARRSPEEVIGAVEDAVWSFGGGRFADDVAMLAMRVGPKVVLAAGTPDDDLTLQPVPSSVVTARHWLVRHLSGRTPLIDDAALLVTEVVTNAVIHARTTVDLHVELRPASVRVEVADASPVLPVAKRYPTDASTGRGLSLLASLSSAWGVTSTPQGKVVWFELTDDEHTPVPRSMAATAPLAGPVPEAGLRTVCLVGAPISLLRRTAEHYDALFRELRLIAGRSTNGPVPPRLLAIGDELAARYTSFTAVTNAVHPAAAGHGQQPVDIEYQVPPDAGPRVAHYDELLDEVDAWSRAGELLTLAPPSDAVAIRKWVLAEFVCQLDGDRPVAWPDSPWATGIGT